MKKFFLHTCIFCLLASCQIESLKTSRKTTVTGTVIKVYGATVEVYQYLKNGERGALLATAYTDSKGNFEVTLPYKGPAEIVVKQGEYKDEASGIAVKLGNHSLRSMVYLDQGIQEISITALTTIAASYIEKNNKSDFNNALNEANSKVAQLFDIADVDISKEIPADFSCANLSFTKKQIKYGAIQAGLSQVIKEHNLPPDQLLALIEDISKDYSDGKLDEKIATDPFISSLSIKPEQAINELKQAIIKFLNGPENASNYYFAI